MRFNKFNFNPNEFRFEAKLANNVLSFDKIKMYDKNHTIFITGTILTDTLTINAKAYYTPSSIELLNSIPVVVSVATLGQNKNGLVSLEFDIYGSIFTPEVKFNKASPIKSIWKLGISAVFLPLLLL
jgi:hypothetical protein